MLTGADGTFEFDGMAAEMRSNHCPETGLFSRAGVFPGRGEQKVHQLPNLQPIELKLYPEAVIYGRLTNEEGGGEGMTVTTPSHRREGHGEST